MHSLALCGLIPCRIKLFLSFLFDAFTSRIVLISFLLIDTYYMYELFSDNKNFFKDKHLSLFVTVYSTINVRVNNYCVAFSSYEKKRPFGRFNLAYDQGKLSLRESHMQNKITLTCYSIFIRAVSSCFIKPLCPPLIYCLFV